MGIDKDAGLIEAVAVVDWDDVEELVDGVGIEGLIPEDALQCDCLISFF